MFFKRIRFHRDKQIINIRWRQGDLAVLISGVCVYPVTIQPFRSFHRIVSWPSCLCKILRMNLQPGVTRQVLAKRPLRQVVRIKRVCNLARRTDHPSRRPPARERLQVFKLCQVVLEVVREELLVSHPVEPFDLRALRVRPLLHFVVSRF